MMKFKTGDIIKSGAMIFKVLGWSSHSSNHWYEVVVLASADPTEIYTTKRFDAHVIDRFYSLKITFSDHKYSVGDILIYNQNEEYEILAIEDEHYKLRIIRHPSLAPSAEIRCRIATVDRNATIKSSIKQNDCSCDGRTLLHTGCSCGYAKVSGKRWGLGA